MKNQYSIERSESIDNARSAETDQASSKYNLDRTLKMMAEIHLVGDLVPHAWFSKIMLDCDPLYKINFTQAPTKINAIKERTVYIYLDPISNDLVYTVELPEDEDENETNYQSEKEIVTAVITRDDLPEFYDSLFEKAVHGFNEKNLNGLEKDRWLTEKKAFFRMTTQREHTRGKADLHGILLLSKIVYWYRPRLELDERTGRILGYRKKFKADKLQHSIGSFARKLGVLYRQVSEALQRLEERGLITREYRLLKINGEKLPNRLFIGINADAILAINKLDAKVLDDETMDEHSTKKPLQYHGAKFAPPVNTTPNDGFNSANEYLHPTVEVSCDLRSTMVRDLHHGTAQNAPPSCIDRMIYTNNTTKISTENTAAEAIGDFEASASVEHIAAAAANHLQQNTMTVICLQGLPCASASPVHRINKSAVEPCIGNALTENQKLFLAQRLSIFPLDEVADKELPAEIEAGLLDPQCFSKCGTDYHHKLNAMVMTLEKGNWTPPASYFSRKAKTLSEEKKALNAMLSEYNQYYNSYLNFDKKRMDLTQNDKKATWDYVILMLKNTWKKLYVTYKTIRESFPAVTIAPIPAEPADFLETAYA